MNKNDNLGRILNFTLWAQISRGLWIGITVFLLTPGSMAQSQKSVFHVRYISNENVYLDAGSDAGLGKGDVLIVRKNDKVVATLAIVFISRQSASCEIISKQGMIFKGDSVFLIKRNPARKSNTMRGKTESKAQPKQRAPSRKAPARKVKVGKKKRNRTRVSGSASLQYYQLIDHSARNMNFDQPTFRLRLRVKKIAGKDYNLNIRTRSRYYQRRTSYNSIPKDTWRNRIYEVSFDYSDKSSFFNYQFGRIISNKFSGIGYIDGALVQMNLNGKMKTGIFAGTQPQWQFSNFQTSMEKYGGFLNYTSGTYSGRRFESTLAAAGEYHGATVSREFLYWQNSYSSNQRWNFYQSMELDINRAWRKNLVQRNFSLSSFYFSARLRISRSATTSLSYDNRKNHYSYETRSLADSLFDDAFRHGVRSTFSLRLNKTMRFYTNVGIRKRTSDKAATVSYSGSLNKYNFIFRRLNLNLRFSGFSNLYARGFNPSVRLGKSFRQGHTLNVSYGNYNYILDSTNKNRFNQWMRIDALFELKYHLFLSGEFGYNWGDDSIDQRILTELGYRF